MAERVALVTGFEPYGGRGLNPSAEVARRLDGTTIADTRVAGRTFPVSYRALRQNLAQAIAETRPAVMLSLGLWPGESVIRLERIGINVADFEIPDNEGECLVDAVLADGGKDAHFATLPLRAIEGALLDAGIPARISSTAGTFLCNATLYSELDILAGNGADVPCGFIHLPYLPEQVAGMIAETREQRSLELHQRADVASMTLDTMVEAARVALSVGLTGHA